MILKRIWETDTATYGVMIDDVPFAVTLELPWRNNRQDISCIPAGNYYCRKITSPKFGQVFQVINVPGRENILIHKGNIDEDTKGCVIIGEMFERFFYKDKWWNGILRSGKGFKDLMERGGGGFRLDVINAMGGIV